MLLVLSTVHGGKRGKMEAISFMISPIANAVILLLLLSIPGGGYALFPYVIIFSVVGALRYRANHQSRQALISMLIAIVGLSLFAFRYSYFFWS